MERAQAIDQLADLLERSANDTTVSTSMRFPVALRDAAALAVTELGIAPSATLLTIDALRTSLEAVLMREALEEHYRAHPTTRPSLAELAIAAAEIDGHPLAARPAQLERAAAEVAARRPDATPEDVLLWAEARGLSAA